MPPALRDIRYFLLDMDGTIYLGPKALPGAADLIAYLRASGRAFLFFTNNPTQDAGAYAEKLAGMGIDAAPENILTSGEATARYLAHSTPHKRVFVLGTPSFEGELARAGLECCDEKADAVVLSFDTTLTYRKLETAGYLLAEGLPYYATNPDLVCPTQRGSIPDCGAMAALLEAATGRSPKYIGKPHAEMVNMGMEKLGAQPEATAMVGDRLYTDMEMAYRAGIASVLLLSGETKRAALDVVQRRPDFLFEDAAALLQALRDADA